MNIKTVNEIFGYGLFGIGALKIVFTILVFFSDDYKCKHST